jgi:hypothetical protein
MAFFFFIIMIIILLYYVMLLLLHIALCELVGSTGAGTDGRVVSCASLSAYDRYVRSTYAHGTLYVPEALSTLIRIARCRCRTNQCASRSQLICSVVNFESRALFSCLERARMRKRAPAQAPMQLTAAQWLGGGWPNNDTMLDYMGA